MGLYPIDCPQCKKPFMWFSGNLPDQRCVECKGYGLVLTEGRPLEIEDLNVTMSVVTYIDPYMHILYRHKGRTSKRRFNNIMKMAAKRYPSGWWLSK